MPSGERRVRPTVPIPAAEVPLMSSIVAGALYGLKFSSFEQQMAVVEMYALVR